MIRKRDLIGIRLSSNHRRLLDVLVLLLATMTTILATMTTVLATGSWSHGPESSRSIKAPDIPLPPQKPIPHPGQGPPRIPRPSEEEMRSMKLAELAMYHEDNADFGPDNAVEILHEFKLTIGPARQECFFQKMKSSSEFHFYFQVLSGADRNIDVVVRGPDGNTVDQHLWSNQGRTERTLALPGVYAVCLGNMMSRFSSKLVHFYLVSFLVEEWQKLTKDLEQFDIGVQNFTYSLEGVNRNVHNMQRSQAVSRQAAAADWYLVQQENSDVQRWSLLLCVVIVATSISQVLFVRRLFRTPNVTTSTAKPRA